MRRYLQTALDAVEWAPWLTRNRLLRCGAVCAFLTIAVLVLNVAALHAGGRTEVGGETLGRDFFTFWSSAVFAAAGRPEAAYVIGPHNSFDHTLPYPPIVILLCWPLASLPYVPAYFFWIFLGAALCIWSLSRLVGWEMAAVAAIGTPAAFVNIFIGQSGYYTAVLLAWGLMLVERRPVLAGILWGTLGCKPQLAILLPIALAAGQRWRSFIAAAATVVGLAAASAVLLGPDTWIGFLDRALLQRGFMESRAAAWPWMPTVFAMMRLSGASAPTAYMVQGISAISAAAAVAALWRSQCSLGVKSAGLVVATFLATPYAWAYDAVVLVFAAAWLGNDAIRTGFRAWEKITVFVLLTLPAVSLIPAKLLDLHIAPVLLWLTMAVLLRRGLGCGLLSPVRSARPAQLPL